MKKKPWAEIIKDPAFKRLGSQSSTAKEFSARLANHYKYPISIDALRNGWKKHGKGSLEDLLKRRAFTPQEIVEQKKSDVQIQKLRTEHKALADELAESNAKLTALLGLSEREIQPVPIKSKPSKRKQATAFALASDWHVEETVDPKTVNNLNKYDLTVARARARSFFRGVDWLVESHRKSMDIDTLVLWLGGDLMTGYIHEELVESNGLSPTETVLWLIGELSAGIDFLKAKMKLRVMCNYGNHGRTTVKRRISTGYKNSYEWLMYNLLAQRYSEDKNVTFDVANGDHLYLKIYDKTIRFTHGDNFQYGGGVGGITIPIMKGIDKLQTARHADITCMGHFHQQVDFNGLLVNGSLIGYNAYAMKINAPYAPPKQTFFLLSPDAPVGDTGKCQVTSIWLKDTE